MTKRWERANTVRPQTEFNEQSLNPLHDESGDAGADKVYPNKEEQAAWKEAREKIEDLETRMAEQFEDNNGNEYNKQLMLQAPAQPTQDEWNRHQLTHTPFAAWCPHCLASRNARRNHPKQGRKGRLVPDTEIGEGPS